MNRKSIIILAIVMGLATLLQAGCHILCPPAYGQCVGGVCPTGPRVHPREHVAAADYNKHASIFKVQSNDTDGRMSHGTGVAIWFNEVPVVVTNYHNVRDARRGQVYVYDAKGKNYPCKLLGYNAGEDVAAIYVPGLPRSQTATYQRTWAFRPRTRVWMYGFGKDRRLAWSTGFTTSLVNPNSMVEVQGISTTQGDSGGPVIAQGGLIGIQRLGNERGVAIFVPIPRICTILQRLGICRTAAWYVPTQPAQIAQAPRGPPAAAEPTDEELIETALDMTKIDSAMTSMAESSRVQADAVVAYLNAQTNQINRQIAEDRAQRIQGPLASGTASAMDGYARAGMRGAAADVLRNEQAQTGITDILLWAFAALGFLVPGGGIVYTAVRLALPWAVKLGSKTFANLLDSNETTPADNAVAAVRRRAAAEE